MSTSAPRGSGTAGARVAEPTPWFWMTTALVSGMGQTAADSLTRPLGPACAGALALCVLVALLTLQARTSRYVAWVYWPALLSAAVFATMAAVALHTEGGLGYEVTTPVCSLVLLTVLAVWYVTEGTLSVPCVRTRRRETFYWCAVLAAFVLGTSAGNLAAASLPQGYLLSTALFLVLIALPAGGVLFHRLHTVAAFWTAYALVRPLGASFANWLATPAPGDGLGWGKVPVTVWLAVVSVSLVGRLADQQKTSGLPHSSRPGDPTP